MDFNNINIPLLVKEGKINDEILLIKQMEDMISKLFASDKKSSILENNTIFIWKISELSDMFTTHNASHEEFQNIKKIDICKYDIPNELLSKCVITGSNIRALFSLSQKNIREELIIYPLESIDYNNYFDMKKFKENDISFTRKRNGRTLTLMKSKFLSPSHVILRSEYLHRVGLYNGDIYVSSMFVVEYKKKYDIITSKLRDPVYGTPIDVFDIFEPKQHNNKSLFNAIKRKDVAVVTELKNIDYNQIHNGLTCIEYAIELFSNEDHPMILDQLRQIIMLLNSHTYTRPSHLFAKIKGLDKKDVQLYNQLLNSPNKLKISDVIIQLKSIDDINKYILELLLAKDRSDAFYDYLNYINGEIDSKIIDLMIKYKSIDTIKKGIINKKFSEYNTYKSILFTEELDLFKMLDNFNTDIAINFLKDIVQKNLLRSFYFLYKMDDSIIDNRFDDDDTILHILDEKEETIDFIKLVISLNPDILNRVNNKNETPICKHSRINNQTIIKTLLEYEPDVTIFDCDNNTFIHYLCKHGSFEIIRTSLRKHNELIDIQNKYLETPAILACRYKHEDLFYFLKGLKADLKKTDIYGNTAYHYICRNQICIGMIIEDVENKFGYKPSDYCEISLNYYYFM